MLGQSQHEVSGLRWANVPAWICLAGMTRWRIDTLEKKVNHVETGPITLAFPAARTTHRHTQLPRTALAARSQSNAFITPSLLTARVFLYSSVPRAEDIVIGQLIHPCDVAGLPERR